MQVLEIMHESVQVCNERNRMHRNMCLLEKLYQWAINASKSNQESGTDRRVLKQTVLALHSLVLHSVSIVNTQHCLLRHCLHNS